MLLIEDESTIRFSIGRFFRNRGFEVQDVGSSAEGEGAFRRHRPDVVLLDYNLPDRDGLQTLARLRLLDATVPVLILTGHGSIDLAVRAIKEGAEQFFTKPVELAALLVVIERLLEHQRNRQERLAGRTRDARQSVYPFGGESTAIRALAELAPRVAAGSSPVLILGETGTGKGVLARWIHAASPRADEPFVDLNCAGLTRDFLESELFGHEKGVFTGAVAAKPGLFEVAHRGTLFLDEIGDVDPTVQPKLLKVLEDQRFRRMGDVRDRQVDVRLVAATHHDLAALVASGRFREDLYYRINALPLRVPALRDRGRDVVLLARALLARVAAELGRPSASLTPEGEEALLRHAWPGNVRELRNVLERAVLLCDRGELGPADLWPGGQGAAPSRSEALEGPPPEALTLDEVERRHVEAVLRGQGGNVVAAARILGVSRSALYERLKKHGLSARRG